MKNNNNNKSEYYSNSLITNLKCIYLTSFDFFLHFVKLLSAPATHFILTLS